MDTLWIQINLRSFINQMDASSWFMTPFLFKCRFFCNVVGLWQRYKDCDRGTNILRIYLVSPARLRWRMSWYLVWFLVTAVIIIMMITGAVLRHKQVAVVTCPPAHWPPAASWPLVNINSGHTSNYISAQWTFIEWTHGNRLSIQIIYSPKSFVFLFLALAMKSSTLTPNWPVLLDVGVG